MWQHVGSSPPLGMATHSEPIGLQEFLSSLSAGDKEPVPRVPAAKKAKVEIDPAMLSQFPWLADLASADKDAAASSHSQTQEACEAEDSPAEPIDEDALVAQAWENLQAQRQEWQAALLPEAGDLVIGHGDRGKVYEASVAKSKPGAPKQWRTQYNLPRLATYSLDAHGPGIALALSMEWRARVQHFYDLRHSQLQGYVHTRSDEAFYNTSQAWADLVHSLHSVGKTRDSAHAIEFLFPGVPT